MAKQLNTHEDIENKIRDNAHVISERAKEIIEYIKPAIAEWYDERIHYGCLARYAQASAEISLINDLIKAMSPVLKSDNGGLYINTFWSARSMREKVQMQCEKELGLTPLSQMKLRGKREMGRPKSGDDNKGKNPFSNFFSEDGE